MIVGFCGKAGAGKSTAATYLSVMYGWNIVSLATPLKSMVDEMIGHKVLKQTPYKYHPLHSIRLNAISRRMFGIDAPPHDIIKSATTVGRLYQLLGTDVFRAVDSDIWLNYFIKHVDCVSSNIIIDDVRFENEAVFVRSHGVLVNIQRSSLNTADGRDLTHASESKSLAVDMTLQNNATINDFKNTIIDFFTKYDLNRSDT